MLKQYLRNSDMSGNISAIYPMEIGILLNIRAPMLAQTFFLSISTFEYSSIVGAGKSGHFCVYTLLFYMKTLTGYMGFPVKFGI